MLRAHRGWTDEEWDGAGQRLRARGLLTDEGRFTERGRALHAELERLTDRLALQPWAALDDAAIARVQSGLAPVLDAIASAGAVPYPNAMALPPPARAAGS